MSKKEWTVIMYLNGSNELAIEMENTFKQLCKINRNLEIVQSNEYINMADYRNLYDFIKWAANKFPAKRYMVSISGHGFIVASLSDLCGKEPYIMGMYEMCTAIKYNWYWYINIRYM